MWAQTGAKIRISSHFDLKNNGFSMHNSVREQDMRSVRNPVERRAAPIKSRLRDEGCVDDLQRVNKTYRGRMADVSALCYTSEGIRSWPPGLASGGRGGSADCCISV